MLSLTAIDDTATTTMAIVSKIGKPIQEPLGTLYEGDLIQFSYGNWTELGLYETCVEERYDPSQDDTQVEMTVKVLYPISGRRKYLLSAVQDVIYIPLAEYHSSIHTSYFKTELYDKHYERAISKKQVGVATFLTYCYNLYLLDASYEKLLLAPFQDEEFSGTWEDPQKRTKISDSIIKAHALVTACIYNGIR